MAEQTKMWSERSAFAGFDWASRHHAVVVVDGQGTIVEDLEIEDTAAGWQQLRQRLARYPDLAVVIETCSGAAVERLLSAGYAVYPINPKAARRYRERKAPSGVKTDHLDAWSLADALRMEGRTWRVLQPEDPLTAELRLLCRDEVALIEQRTALICQLRAALHEYYPVALQAFEDWTLPAAWAFVERFPSAAELAQAGKRRWEKFLHAHQLYHSTELYARRLQLFAEAEQFCGGAAVTQAKRLLALALAHQLRVLQQHLDKYREQIQKLFVRHPDHDLFDSLPGTGPKLAPRLLAELGSDRVRFDSAEGLQCYAGTAPISYQSGQMHKTRFRRACHKPLRAAVHHWSNLSRAQCPWAQAYYQHKRQNGMSHACAVRCLGQRWLKILWRMWQTGSVYNPELHQRNQLQHGSWVLALVTQPSPAASP